MDKCCTSMHIPRPQRRIHGLQLPLNYQQVIGWIVFIITALINFIIITEIQFYELKVVSIVTFVILYVCHALSHVTAALIDPSEKELRKLKVNTVPEFDRSVHAHVIENGRCHLCNIYTSSKSTKHCSLCNKCVDQFDHHCKWLNNCVGKRNYAAFITCVSTALLISLYTTTLCVADIVIFLEYPKQLSGTAQNFVNCSAFNSSHYNKYCTNSISFLVFLILFGVSALAIACALMHLCCFHVYISYLGVSTYEYIVRSGNTKTSKSANNKFRKCCPTDTFRNINIISKHAEKKVGRYKAGNVDAAGEEIDVTKEGTQNSSQENEDTNVTNLISVLIANEIDKARKIFVYDRNKIHPENQRENSNK